MRHRNRNFNTLSNQDSSDYKDLENHMDSK